MSTIPGKITHDQNKSELLKIETLSILKLKPWLLWFQDFVQYCVIVCFSYAKWTLNPSFSNAKYEVLVNVLL